MVGREEAGRTASIVENGTEWRRKRTEKLCYPNGAQYHNKAEVLSNTTYICYRWFSKLSTSTCFSLYIGHLHVVLFLVLRLTIQYTIITDTLYI